MLKDLPLAQIESAGVAKVLQSQYTHATYEAHETYETHEMGCKKTKPKNHAVEVGSPVKHPLIFVLPVITFLAS